MAGRQMLSPKDMTGNKITHMADGSVADDAATYGQVLNLVNGKDYKDGVRAASTATVNIASPGTTLDAVALATNDRILLKDQSTASQNGIWVWNGSAAALTRPVDFPAGSTGLVSQGATVVVDEGTANAATQWTLTTSGVINVNTTSLTFTKTTGGATYTQGNGIDITGTVISAKTAALSGILLSGAGIAIDPSIVMQRFASLVANPSALTTIRINHNLGTRDVHVGIYSATSTYDEADVQVQHFDTNNVDLVFGTAPATNAWRVVVIG